MLGSRGLLARAIAEMIAADNLAEGDRLFDENEDAPTGDGLGERITRAQYERRVAAQQAEWKEALRYDADDDDATRAAILAMKAEQQG